MANKITQLNVLLILVLLSCQAYGQKNFSWELQQQDPNISIYTRKLQSSDFLQTKAEISLNFSAAKILALMPSGEKCWRWQKRCKLTRLIQKESINEEYAYTVINLPWPLKDRDFVFHSQLQFDTMTNTTTITLKPSSNSYPIDKKYIRGQANISYAVKAITDSSSHLTITMHTEFAGSIMPSILNSKLVEELHKDIKSLILLLNREGN